MLLHLKRPWAQLLFWLVLSALCLSACDAAPFAGGCTIANLPAGAEASFRAQCYKETAAAAQKTSSVALSSSSSGSLRATAIRQATDDTLALTYANQTVTAGDARETARWDDATDTANARNRATANAVGTAAAEAQGTRAASSKTEAAAQETRVAQKKTADAQAILNADGTATAVPKTASAASFEATRVVREREDAEARYQTERNIAGFTSTAWAIGGALAPIVIYIGALTLMGLGAYFIFLVIRNWDLRKRIVLDDRRAPIGLLMPPSGLPFQSSRQPAMIRLLNPPRELPPPAPLVAPDEITEGEIVSESDVVRLVTRPLDLSEQPTALHVPIGTTGRLGKDWMSLREMGHVLVGGASGMGKSLELHGMLQALTYGKAVELYAYDGKRGSEFSGYCGAPNFHFVPDDGIHDALGEIQGEMLRRFGLGITDLENWNRQQSPHERLRPLVVVIDELFDVLLEKALEDLLVDLARKGRSVGIHLILATQLPDGESVPRQLRGNALTRISFAVFNLSDSKTILSQPGAERLPHKTGRMLVWWGGQMFEAQKFEIQKPSPQSIPQAQASRSAFAPEELQMLLLAIENGGWFVVREIAGDMGIDDSRVTRLGRRLEKAGLLSKVERDEKGQPRGRKVSPELLNQVRQDLRTVGTPNGKGKLHVAQAA